MKFEAIFQHLAISINIGPFYLAPRHERGGKFFFHRRANDNLPRNLPLCHTDPKAMELFTAAVYYWVLAQNTSA